MSSLGIDSKTSVEVEESFGWSSLAHEIMTCRSSLGARDDTKREPLVQISMLDLVQHQSKLLRTFFFCNLVICQCAETRENLNGNQFQALEVLICQHGALTSCRKHHDAAGEITHSGHILCPSLPSYGPGVRAWVFFFFFSYHLTRR